MIIRYPGGKGKLTDRIIGIIKRYVDSQKGQIHYIEPFFGSGAIGLALLPLCNVQTAYFNDIDPGIAALWRTIKFQPEKLIERIQNFCPTVEIFHTYKKILIEQSVNIDLSPENDEIVDIAFKKLAVHQLSFSGLGTKSGGPIGGNEQKSDYKVDCRWSPNSLVPNIRRIHRLLNERRIEIRNRQFNLSLTDEKNTFVYLDPPYYIKGPGLYQFYFDRRHHELLAKILKTYQNPWLLSYDDCAEIRYLYSFAHIEKVSLNYSINGATSKNELLITSKENSYLLESKKAKRFDYFAKDEKKL